MEIEMDLEDWQRLGVFLEKSPSEEVSWGDGTKQWIFDLELDEYLETEILFWWGGNSQDPFPELVGTFLFFKDGAVAVIPESLAAKAGVFRPDVD